MVDIQDEFDFSEYPPEHPLYSEQNMKVIGKFKDELHGCAMTKCVGLPPKLYSYEYEEEGKVVEKNTAKGVKTNVKNTKLTFADYEHSLRMLDVKTVSMNTIRSDHHNVYSLQKRSVCPPSMTKDTFVRMVSAHLHMDIGAYYNIIQ